MIYILAPYCILCWILFGWEAHKKIPRILDVSELSNAKTELINFGIALIVLLSPLWAPFEWYRKIDIWRRKRKTFRAIKRLKDISRGLPSDAKQQFDETMAETEQFFERRFRD